MESTTGPESHRYRYGGLAVDSEVFLPGLEEISPAFSGTAKHVTFRIRQGKPSVDRVLLFSWSGRYELTLWTGPSGWIFGVGSGTEFHLDAAASAVECIPGSGVWNAGDGEAFVRRILPRIVERHGATVLHAASVDSGDGAVLLCGPSHAGKSTLAAGLHDHFGWNPLSDDMTLLVNHGGGITAVPADRGFCLWEDSTLAMVPRASSSYRLSTYETKFIHQPSPPAPRNARAVRAVYLLGDPASVPHGLRNLRKIPVAPREALATLFGLLVRFNPGDRSMDGRHFHVLGRLAGTIPTRFMEFPRRYDLLPEVTAGIREDLEAHTEPSCHVPAVD